MDWVNAKMDLEPVILSPLYGSGFFNKGMKMREEIIITNLPAQINLRLI